MAARTKATDIGKCRDALVHFLDGTAVLHNPPKATDPDQIITAAFDELERIRSANTKSIKVESEEIRILFVDSRINHETILTLIDAKQSKVLRRMVLKGAAVLQVENIKRAVEDMAPNRLVIDRTGLGISYYENLMDWFSGYLMKQENNAVME